MDNSSRFRICRLEVVVVFLIVVLIVALLLPAVQQARESARRAQCKNNLKQLGIGLNSYVETHAVFPPGWIAVGDKNSPAGGETSAFGWGVYVMPYLDASPLYDWISPGETSFRTGGWKPHGGLMNEDKTHSTVPVWRYTHFSTQRIRCHQCPSDTGDRQTSNAVIPLTATSNYPANFGVGLPVSNHTRDELQGIFGANSSVGLKDIWDGAAYVIAIGERRSFPGGREWPVNQTQGNYNSYWAGIPDFDVVSPLAIVFTVTDGDITQRGVFDGLNQVCQFGSSAAKPGSLKVFGVNRTENDERNVTTAGLSSHHPGGCQVLMADGSVRFVLNSVDDGVLAGLARRSDGCRITDQRAGIE